MNLTTRLLSRDDAVIGWRTPVVAATPSSQMVLAAPPPPVSATHRKMDIVPKLRRGGGAADTSCDEGVAAATPHVFRFSTASLRLSLFVLAACSISTAAANTITVNSTADVAANDGQCTLREAIIAANTNTISGAMAGECVAGAAGLDTIAFNIAGGGVKTIVPGSALPAITEPVVIDGYAQPGSSANTLAVGDNSMHLIELNGANVTGTGIGLDLTGGSSTVRGLVINRFGNNVFGAAGIRLASDNNVVAGNFIGANAAGSAALANAVGVTINSGANNLIGGTTPADRNIFAGDATENSQGGAGGLNIRTSQPGTRVQGNYIGTNAAGNAPLGNFRGINVIGFAAADITIGGLTSTPGAGAGNVISGNRSNGGIDNDGIYIASRPGGLTIQGNIIGLDASGTTALPNGVSGINLVSISSGAGALLIGGTAPGARNVIFNNRISGIVSNAIGLTVQGNFIGTDITGTSHPPGATGFFRGGVGISIGGSATIGGASAGARNVISCDGLGLQIFGGLITLQGNYIGIAADGVTPLGNNSAALRVENDAVVTLGGTGAGEGNIVANNFQAGVAVKNTARATILGNSIFSNGTDPSTNGYPGIDLNDDKVTPNDIGDADTGPNLLQNYPVLTSTTVNAGTVRITGSLNSTASTTFRLEFFGNDKVNPLAFGEGRYFLGFANVTTDANGNASFDVSFAATAGAAHVTATATDPLGNTSEFSAAIGQLLNIATRLRVQTGDNVLIGGFIITGSDSKKVIIRGIGPSLAQFFAGFLADPTLDLYQGNMLLATNDDWKTRPDGSSQQAEIEATTLAPTNDLEAALVRNLPANNTNYTAIVRGKDNTTGIGVVEAYDLDQAANSKLANISTRGLVETGDDVLIGGFIPGNGVTKVIIRAIGPALVNFGISNPLLDPTLELFNGSGTSLALNDDWQATQKTEIEATGLQPNDPRESAIVSTLTPGNYTAVVRGKNNSTGIALVEVYNVP